MDSRRYRGASRSSPWADAHGQPRDYVRAQGTEREKENQTEDHEDLFVKQNLLRDQRVVINRSLFAGVKPQEAI